MTTKGESDRYEVTVVYILGWFQGEYKATVTDKKTGDVFVGKGKTPEEAQGNAYKARDKARGKD